MRITLVTFILQVNKKLLKTKNIVRKLLHFYYKGRLNLCKSINVSLISYGSLNQLRIIIKY